MATYGTITLSLPSSPDEGTDIPLGPFVVNRLVEGSDTFNPELWPIIQNNS